MAVHTRAHARRPAAAAAAAPHASTLHARTASQRAANSAVPAHTGIDDIIVSDNWENSYSQQSISSISNGFSFAYHINMLVSSAGGGGGGAGGSAIFSNGKTLPNLLNDKNGKPLPSPLNMLMNGATDVPGNYFGPGTEGNPHQDGCIDPSTGKMVFMGGCINLANLATVTTPTPDFSPSNEAVMPKDDVAAWPVKQEPEPGMALVLQKLVENTHKLTPLKFPSVYEDPDSTNLAISVLGNVADVTVLADLSDGSAGTTYAEI